MDNETLLVQNLKKRIQQLEEKQEHDWNGHYRHIMQLLDWYLDDEGLIVITDEQLPELAELIIQEFKGEI